MIMRMLMFLLFLLLPSFYPNERKFEEIFYQKDGGLIIEHKSYVLSYDVKFKTTKWSSYMLTKHMVSNQVIDRTDNFTEDPLVDNSPSEDDYIASGYDRGHLVNAQDMRFDVVSQHESFYMTNMLPQHPRLNRGIWKKLEFDSREWAEERDTIIIISGPVFVGDIKTIGNKIPVPTYCYKIVYDPETKEAIAFLFKNEKSHKDLSDHIVTIDTIESLTNIDFLYSLEDCLEEDIESVPNRNWIK